MPRLASSCTGLTMTGNRRAARDLSRWPKRAQVAAGHGDARGAQHLLDAEFVQRQPQRQRTGAGVGDAHQVQQAGHAHLQLAASVDFFTEIENEPRRQPVQGQNQILGELFDRKHVRIVAQLPQALLDRAHFLPEEIRRDRASPAKQGTSHTLAAL